MRLIDRFLFFYRNVKSRFIAGFEDLSFEDQSNLLVKYKPDINTNYQRSYSQFLCHKTAINKTFYLFLYMLMLIPLAIAPMLFLLFRIFTSRKSSVDAVYFYVTDIIPASLVAKRTLHKSSNLFSLSSTDAVYFIRLFWKNPVSVYFNFTVLMRLANMSHNLYLFSPQIIFNNVEYSFTSSILTEYLNSKGVEHINIMHGEKLFNIRDAYANFNQFYVWDKHYVNLFAQLGYDEKILKIEKPGFLSAKCDEIETVTHSDDKIFKYYLNGQEDAGEQEKLLEVFRKLNKNYKVVVRFHPRYSNNIERLKTESFVTFEDPGKINIRDSICESSFVCAKYSTVLYQAYLFHKTAIIDDIIDVKLFNSLKQLNYIMIMKEKESQDVKLLSNLLMS